MQDSSKKKIVLFDIDYTLFDTDILKQSNLKIHSLYKEVTNVLDQLSKKVNIGIFSEGEITLQKKKLIETEIEKYFYKEHVYIVEKKDQRSFELFKNYEHFNLFLVDDKLTVLYEIKKIYPYVFTIWVKRGKYANVQKPIKDFVPDAQLDNLEDLVSIVESN